VLTNSLENHKDARPQNSKHRSPVVGKVPASSKLGDIPETGYRCPSKVKTELEALPKMADSQYCNPNQDDTECSDLSANCIDCLFNSSCHYGTNVTVYCIPKPEVNCKV